MFLSAFLNKSTAVDVCPLLPSFLHPTLHCKPESQRNSEFFLEASQS